MPLRARAGHRHLRGVQDAARTSPRCVVRLLHRLRADDGAHGAVLDAIGRSVSGHDAAGRNVDTFVVACLASCHDGSRKVRSSACGRTLITRRRSNPQRFTSHRYGDDRRELFEDIATLLPIFIVAATATTIFLDGGGVENGAWNGVTVRDKNPKNLRGPQDYFKPKNNEEFDKWLSANPGGGKTNFAYNRPKTLVPPPEPAGSDDDLIKLTAVLGVSSASVLLAKAGVLGGGAGFLAEFLLNAWNGIATSVLPGAILKY